MEIVICPICGEKLQRGKYDHWPDGKKKNNPGLRLAGEHKCFIESQKELSRLEQDLKWRMNE